MKKKVRLTSGQWSVVFLIGLIATSAVMGIWLLVVAKPVGESQPKQVSYNACYVKDASDQWAVFYPHWENGVATYALDLTDKDAKPFLLGEDQGVTGQWTKLASDAPYLALSQLLEDNTGRVLVYNLETHAVVFDMYTSGPPYLQQFADGLLVYYHYGSENKLQWYTLRFDGEQATIVSVESAQYVTEPPQEIPDWVKVSVAQAAPFCQSWPGAAVG